MSTERLSILPEDENSLFVDILHEAPLFANRKPMRIVWSIFYFIVLAGYVVLVAAAPMIFELKQRLLLSLLCSCSAALLLFTGIIHQYLLYQVHKVRLQGYYSFSQKLKHVVRLPFTIIAYGTAVVLLVVVWRPHIGFLTLLTLLRIIMFVEVFCAASFMAIYVGYAYQYNSVNSQPDVLKTLYSPLQVEGLRYHDGADQQMVLLQYQRENLRFLSEEILRLQECLSKYECSSDGSRHQVDLPHLLAAREQELRTLTAEMSQVQSELSLARSLIAERDSEIQRVQTMNNQYIEEIERVRAIMGEWSALAAKLERALELERASNFELKKLLSSD